MSDDLRALAQAVVDAPYGSNVWRAAVDAVEEHLGVGLDSHAVTRILAALDAADAQGYARAMGEVVEHASQQSDECHENRWDPCVMGRQDAWDDCYEWARERLPAAAEKEHG